MNKTNLFIIGGNSEWVKNSVLPSSFIVYGESITNTVRLFDNLFCLGISDLTTEEFIKNSDISNFYQCVLHREIYKKFECIIKYVKVSKNFNIEDKFDSSFLNLIYDSEKTKTVIYISLPPNLIYLALKFLINKGFFNANNSKISVICDKPCGHNLEEALNIKKLIDEEKIDFRIFDHFMLKEAPDSILSRIDDIFYESADGFYSSPMEDFYPKKTNVYINYIEKYSKERLEKRNIFAKDLIVDMFQSHILTFINKFACAISKCEDCRSLNLNPECRSRNVYKNIKIKNIETSCNDKESLLFFKCKCEQKCVINGIKLKITFYVHLEKHLTKEKRNIKVKMYGDDRMDINISMKANIEKSSYTNLTHVKLFNEVFCKNDENFYQYDAYTNKCLYNVETAIEYWKVVDREIYSKINKNIYKKD